MTTSILLCSALCGLLAIGFDPGNQDKPADSGPERPRVTWEKLPRRPKAYALVVPPDLDQEKPAPVLIALPPGDQSGRMVMLAFDLYWAAEAQARGWILASPRFDELEGKYPDRGSVMDAVAEDLRERFDVEGGRFYLAGVSNGGCAAFEEAQRMPDRYHALLVGPGYPLDGVEDPGFEAVAKLPVSLFVGGDDIEWLVPMTAARDRLRELGCEVSLRSFPGEGHQPASLTPALLYAELGALREAAAKRVASVEGAAELLDSFHQAASDADGDRYFGSFAPQAVFLGTDPGERWSVEEFRGYAEPYFSQGEGWTYVPRDRHVFYSSDGRVAWFDERLDNESYGEVRGTGVLVAIDGQWRIAQYNLSFPVPNELAVDLVERIRGLKRPKKQSGSKKR